ncbi:hypothetical protein PCASD_04006 [Puccinia coronata f. sp. avenae]|uniref:Uncharacterized protein n=1 Tax=Puccinia coronata f. sp. avenae TaxID=200324 RepID=A0A2N5V5D3_9BASI|nr:hypothetical protein PCASD_04006 [Puccinia coronata f. sp. avenae]
MFHFGIDLFLQEVPPPGYHTDAENCQISENMTTQAYLTKAKMMEQSMVTYTAPEAPKTTKKKADHLVRNHVLLKEAAQKALNSKRNVPGEDLPIPANHAQPGKFSPHAVLTEEIFSRYPPNLDYKKKIPVYVNPHDANQYILLTGRAVQTWAHTLKIKKKGVLLESPPYKLKYIKRSSKKQKVKHVPDLPS